MQSKHPRSERAVARNEPTPGGAARGDARRSHTPARNKAMAAQQERRPEELERTLDNEEQFHFSRATARRTVATTPRSARVDVAVASR